MKYVIAICLLYMAAIVVGVIVRLCVSSRKERLQYIQSFKRGKFALIYLAMMPLYFFAYRYNGVSIEGSIWQSINTGIETVVLKIPYNSLAPLMNTDLFYRIAINVGLILVTLNAVMFTVSFLGLTIINAVSLIITRLFRKKIVVVVGHNDNSMETLKSVQKRDGKKVLMGSDSQQLKDDAFVLRAGYVKLSKHDDFGKKISKLCGKFNKKSVSVILNCEDDETALRYVKQLWDMMESKKLTDLPLTQPYGLQVRVLGSKANEASFEHYVEKSAGLIRFVNRHTQIAMDFVDKYPMTKFMTDKQIDTSSATVKSDVNLNMFMIGFGNLNEELFLTSVSNNQFLTEKDGKLVPKSVNYHIFDRSYPEGKITKDMTSVHSGRLHYSYKRYEQFLKEHASDKKNYLEFVPAPAVTHIHPYEFTHPDFFGRLHELLTDKNAYSYIVVSFGSDMQNIELAEKLHQKLVEWDVPSVVKLFVKVRDSALATEICNDLNNEDILLFGTDKDCVFNASTILNEKIELMAKRRHLLYAAEYAKKSGELPSAEELEESARKQWYGSKQFQRESNVYACLSLRMKLHLLGYDYAETGEDVSKEFEAKYEKGDKRRSLGMEVFNKQMWSYDNAEQGKASVRWTLAVLEHQRWCANMICNGVIPADKQTIKACGGKVLEKRLHGNITTMDGLKEYRRIMAEAKNKTEEETDVIRYDYQLMDDAVWLLHECGYKLIRKS